MRSLKSLNRNLAFWVTVQETSLLVHSIRKVASRKASALKAELEYQSRKQVRDSDSNFPWTFIKA
jgi:hypothetical protein